MVNPRPDGVFPDLAGDEVMGGGGGGAGRAVAPGPNLGGGGGVALFVLSAKTLDRFFIRTRHLIVPDLNFLNMLPVFI